MPEVKVEDGALSYQGLWTVQHTSHASLHSLHVSDALLETDAIASWSGYFTSLSLYASRGDYGMIEVWLDGAYYDEIDLYHAASQHQALVMQLHASASELHTVQLKKSRRKNPLASSYSINVDYFIVDFNQPSDCPFQLIAAVGDSITFGANVANRPAALYGRLLQRMLSVPVSIHGLSGASIRTVSNVFDAVLAPRQPDVILWLTGMNDPSPQAALEEGIDRIRELLPDATIIVSTIQYNTYYNAAQNAVKVNEVKAACLKKGVPCIDLYAATEGNAYINQPEGTVHPNADGQVLIANLFYSRLVELLAK